MSNRETKRPCEDMPSTSHQTTKRHKQHCPSPKEMSDVTRNIRLAKEIITSVKHKLRNETKNSSTEKLTQASFSKLDEDIKKKTTVGLFGRTGTGKSSLINAVLGESNLLPSGSICACTSVIIQVEANVTNSNYIAEIEFISKQNWEDELETLLKVLSEDDDKDHDMFSAANDKITALYGEEGVFMVKEDLMKDERFSEIPEFLKSKRKTISCKNASELQDLMGCYIQHDDSSPGGCYWPVVKSVTIKIPNCKDFLEHVVLVDLPGTGDCNKSRDQMWRLKLRDCSTVWIVSEINRAGSDKEAWSLLSNSVRDMAEGGECSSISFICTKTDDINPQSYMRSAKLIDEDFQITSEDPQYASKRKAACIKHRNRTAKEKLRKIFNQQDTIKKHFNCGDNFFSVFTVSSEESSKENPLLKPEDTEIPMLKNLLRSYNNTHTTETANLYISGALGILSLIQGYKNTNADTRERFDLYLQLMKNLQNTSENMQEYFTNVLHSLKKHLSNGAAESERNCIENAKTVIEPKRKNGRGFHRTLAALCSNDGYYRSKTGVESDLNRCLVKHMYNHIDKEFSDFFSGLQGNETDVNADSLQTKIDSFTIIPEDLLHNYEDSPVLSHMLKFLKTEENNMKVMLKQQVLQQKKRIYASLAESIKTSMLPCYQRAAAVSGTGSMKKKQAILLDHIESSRSSMFQNAQEDLLKMFEDEMNEPLMEIINKRLREAMDNSLYSENTLPHIDVSDEIKELKKLITHVSD
ncbi:nuclear GTPase SLIP-GC-like isoform X2 [Brachyhypopomus gauderio]|uniref:nuclear GTPase SLIP-GC-like isoform X2 n=1 Tax=Brachyhypopomus gauderio TaxID=698409 RepID=UPI00404111E1